MLLSAAVSFCYLLLAAVSETDFAVDLNLLHAEHIRRKVSFLVHLILTLASMMLEAAVFV